MANITEILGTDSLSSSRVTINENFAALNDDVFNLVSLVNIDNATIQDITSINAESLNLLDGAVSILNADASSMSVGVSTDFTGEANEITVEGLLIQNSVKGSWASPYNLGADSSGVLQWRTYIISTGTTNLPAGIEGQEVTFINAVDSNVSLTSSNSDILGGWAAIQLAEFDSGSGYDGQGSSVTLRFVNGRWAIIGQYKITVIG